MNDNELVSIIVPIYNVEKYITKCVKSLMEQDYESIEIILVNDGSTDKSLTLINELAKKDERIIVINKANGGVSSARNVGVENATGSYLMFVDGDDWVEADYVSYFYRLIKENHCYIGMNKNVITGLSVISSSKEYIISNNEAAENIYRGDILVAVWNKIYSKKIIDEYNIRFREDIWYGEGMLFNIECLQYVDEVVVGERAVYHQITNPNSAVRLFNLESNYCGIKSMEIQKGICKNFSVNVKKAWELHRFYYNRSIIDGLVRTDSVKKYMNDYKLCVKQIRANIQIPLKYERSIKNKIIWLAYYFMPRFAAMILDQRRRREQKQAIKNEEAY